MNGFTLVVDCSKKDISACAQSEFHIIHMQSRDTLQLWTAKAFQLVHPNCRASVDQTHLIVGRPEASPDILVIQNLHFKAEVLFEVFDDHD